MTNNIFIDTSGWIALLFLRDNLHERAAYWMELTKGQQANMFTSTAVLMETLDGLAQQNLRHLSPLLRSAVAHPKVEVVDTNKISFFTAWQLYENRADKNWGITDCTSFGIMSGRDIPDVLTHDIHFAQAGFRPLLREEP